MYVNIMHKNKMTTITYSVIAFRNLQYEDEQASLK